jgi:hypothetical protein
MKYYATIDGSTGWFPFKEGEKVLTSIGTGFVVRPLRALAPVGRTPVHVMLDGHEDEPAWLGTTSVEPDDEDVISLE